MSGERVVRLADAFDVVDLDTFVARARTADPGGAIRLTTHGAVLLATVRLVPGAGLFGGGGVLGLRAFTLHEGDDEAGDAQAGPVDVVVATDAVSDRLARMKRSGELVLSLPPVQVVAPWAGQAPPRSGWQPIGVASGEALRQLAEAGIAEIATGVGGSSGGGPRAGALAVHELRRRVWTRPASEILGGPAGLAFGAHVLGFLQARPTTATGDAQIVDPALFRHGEWWRLSTPAGHVTAR